MNGSAKRYAILVAVAAAVLSVGGCAPQLDRIEVAVLENRNEISQLQLENKRVLQETEALARLLRMESDAGDESAAMRLTKLSQVSDRLERLMQMLEDNAQYIRDLSARVDLLATRSGIPTLGEYKPPPSGGEADQALPEEGRSIFAAAELDRSRGNVDLARAGYEEFLERYGTSEAADDAIYRLGDLAAGAEQYEAALARFRELQQRFPVSDWIPASLFKSRTCLLALDRQEEAWQVGGDLLARFPDSSEAEILREESGRN